jgi:hypothetical protein
MQMTIGKRFVLRELLDFVPPTRFGMAAALGKEPSECEDGGSGTSGFAASPHSL